MKWLKIFGCGKIESGFWGHMKLYSDYVVVNIINTNKLTSYLNLVLNVYIAHTQVFDAN